MGYTKIKQFIDITEVYSYEKNIYPRKPHYKKRSKASFYTLRSSRSVRRARLSFFSLTRNHLFATDNLPHFVTVTYHNEYETPPSLKDSYIYLNAFFKRAKGLYGNDISYIAVPEYQKRGFIHFHSLVWGLPKSVEKERNTRLLQRCWRQGYVDVRCTDYKSPALAGYLAKYFTKAHEDYRTFGRKAYTCSRNIKRPSEKGSNIMSQFVPLIVDNSTLQSITYHDTKWLGKCEKRTFTNKST